LFKAELMNAFLRNCERLTLRNAESTDSATAARKKDETTMPPISISQIRLGPAEPT